MTFGVLITVSAIYGSIFLILFSCFVYAFFNYRAVFQSEKELVQKVDGVLAESHDDLSEVKEEDKKEADKKLTPKKVRGRVKN